MNQELQLIKFRKPEEIRPNELIGDVLFTDNMTTPSALNFVLTGQTKHIVQMSNLNHPHELAVALKITENPEEFFEFPLATIILCPDKGNLVKEFDLRKVYFEVERANQKQEMLDKMEKYLKGISNSPTLISDILSVADELFTNAIYNAPYVDENNTSMGSDRDINQVEVDQNKRPYLFLSDDFERIVVGCCDRYGSLKIQALLNRVKLCYENSISDMINYSTGGAGIGTYIVLEKITSMYVGVQKGVSTLVCCAFPLKMNTKKRSEMPKNIHICEL